VNLATASGPALKDIVAVHVSSVGVAVCPKTVEGLHVALGGVGGVTVVLPSEQVSATAQADCSWLLLAVAELLMLFVLSAVASELEVLSAVFVFVFVFVLLAEAFCITGIIVAVAPKTSIDVIATTIMIPLIVWFIFFSQ
jgi:FtsH-binding integral membrane protein